MKNVLNLKFHFSSYAALEVQKVLEQSYYTSLVSYVINDS